MAEGDQIQFPLMPKEIQTLWRMRQSEDVGHFGVCGCDLLLKLLIFT